MLQITTSSHTTETCYLKCLEVWICFCLDCSPNGVILNLALGSRHWAQREMLMCLHRQWRADNLSKLPMDFKGNFTHLLCLLLLQNSTNLTIWVCISKISKYIFILFFVCVKVSSWPTTQCIGQAGLELRVPSASASTVLGLKVSIIRPGF